MQLRKLPVAQEILMQNRACSLFHFSAEVAGGGGQRAWYLLALFMNQEEDFKTAIAQAGVEVDIAEYGTVLASGLGESAPAEALAALKEKYGIDFCGAA